MNLQPCPHLPGDPLVSDALCARRHHLAQRYTAPDENDMAVSYQPCATCARGAAAGGAGGALSPRLRQAAEAVGSRERGVAAMATASQSVYAETYRYLKTHPGATLAQLAADMNLKLPTAVKRLQRMQERGRVRADGTRRADMRWYVGAA